MDLDKKLRFELEKEKSNEGDYPGSTACVILITPTKIFCANAGDTRAVLKHGKRVVGLSIDHKPDIAREKKRIEMADHTVKDQRVDGSLACSRAFGDFEYKDQIDIEDEDQAVTASPEIISRDRSKDDQFIMLACDGIWDCLSSKDCLNILTHKINEAGNLQKKKYTSKLPNPLKQLFREILAPNTGHANNPIGLDNMSAILIYFPKNMGLEK